MSEYTEQELQEIDDKIIKYLSKSELQSQISEANKTNSPRFNIDIDKMRETDPDLVKAIIKNPMQVLNLIERHLNEISKDLKGEKIVQKQSVEEKKENPIRINCIGNLGKNLVSPRGLRALLSNQYVGVQGIVIRTSIVRPKLVYSAHYCEETGNGSVKEYYDQMTLNPSDRNLNGNFQGQANGYISNAVPTKDNNQNPLSFEYGFSKFKQFQIILVQELPERTPVGQLPRSVEVILEEDLVDKVKPGDRVEVRGVFKIISSQSTSYSGISRNVLISTNIISLTGDIDKPNLTGEDIQNITNLSRRNNVFDILSESIAPGIQGHTFIKRALILQLLGGTEKNLDNGTHLRGDINVLMVGDPSTAKSQFLRYILSISPNAINTTGRGSTGVGLTAAVVVDRDTGDRHLEAGAMVLGDRGIVCIDEFDKMSEADRVAIHEVMEQQTVTIAKAGIHVSLNARCSVLAAANPIYGQYITEFSPSRNIGLPDSLLSRFDLCFVVLDEHNNNKDRLISNRVINNHTFTVDAPNVLNEGDDQVIEPEINTDKGKKTQMYEKYNNKLHGKGKDKKEILTLEFLRKYLYYAKSISNPELTKTSADIISKSWAELREKSADEEYGDGRAVPITVRTLETLIRLATAHAKVRLSKKVEKIDCNAALDLFIHAYNNETELDDKVNDDDMDIDDGGKKSKKGKKKKDEDVEESGIKGEKMSKKDKKGKESKLKKKDESEDVDMELDEMIKAPIDDEEFEVTKEDKNFVYKIIYDKLHKDDSESLPIKDLFNFVKAHKDYKKHKITSRSQLFKVCQELEENSKIFISENQEISLI